MLRLQVFGHGAKILQPTAPAPSPLSRQPAPRRVALGHGGDATTHRGEDMRPGQVMENRPGTGATFWVRKGDFQKAPGSRCVILRLPKSLPDWHLQKTLKSPAASKTVAATSGQSTLGGAQRLLQLRLPAPRLRRGSRPPSPSSARAGCLTPGVPAASPRKAARVTQPDPCVPTTLPGTFGSKQGFNGARKQSGAASL